MDDSDAASPALILILGDQLTTQMASLRHADVSRDTVLLAEVDAEATYVAHHKKKIAFVFAAMRHFASALEDAGWTVRYVRIDDKANTGTLAGEVERALGDTDCERVILTEPGEWRLRAAIARWEDELQCPVHVLEDDRFICSHDAFRAWASGRKSLRMEYFYREMRRQTGLLVDADGNPEGGAWNYDADNRKPAKHDLFMPDVPRFEPDAETKAVLEVVAERYADHFGRLEPFWFATTQQQAEQARDAFLKHALPRFGDYQDAMLSGEPFLYHSVLSIYMNAGLLDPLETCQRAEAEYRNGNAPLNAVEGFIRQIIGWREYVRGIYWREMPDYIDRNALQHDRPLPALYWTADTDMNCLRQAIEQTRDEAYAHHIQRLMVTGLFALLTGVAPKAVHEWYLVVYADAYEWVELPNTAGMSQFADGGLLASKPYAASGSYINKMSDYCKDCAYNVRERTGKDACPFNYLYWSFLARNRGSLEKNPRMAMMYRTYDKFSAGEKAAMTRAANAFLDDLPTAAYDDG